MIVVVVEERPEWPETAEWIELIANDREFVHWQVDSGFDF